MHDVNGEPLEVGDVIAFAAKGYMGLRMGLIVRETKKGMKVAHIETWSSALPPQEIFVNDGNCSKLDKTKPKAQAFLKDLALKQISVDLK